MSQIEFSNAIGISQSSISDIEKGNTMPSVDTVMKICKEFSIDANWLLLDQESKRLISPDDKQFLARYDKLTDREKGRIDQLLSEIEKSKTSEGIEKIGN